MHGLVSLLPSPCYEKVELIWGELEKHCGLGGIRVTPYPHFSWNIARDYDEAKVRELMGEIAGEAEPFRVRTAGIGVFSGKNPVIFIPVVKTRRLIDFHCAVWDRTVPVAGGLAEHYGPEVWVPHISLAYEDVHEEEIDCAMRRLAFRDLYWEFEVDNLAFIHEPDGEIGELRFRIPFGSA